jgi:hypothetical protein
LRVVDASAWENSWNSLPIGRRHADASVGDRGGDRAAATFLPLSCVDGDGAVVGELVGVAHEVQQRLAQPHLVRMHRLDCGIATDRHCSAEEGGRPFSLPHPNIGEPIMLPAYPPLR